MSPVARKTSVVSFSLLAILLVVGTAAISIGTVPIPPGEVVRLLFGGTISEEHRTILLALRLPRVVLAAIVGGGLSIAGTVYQALLRNPLAEPFILGVSSGGTLGAILSMGLGLGLSAFSVPLASFAGSLGVMALVYTIASRYGRMEPTTLLLAGVIVGAFFNAVILALSAVFYREIRNGFLWLMGNTSMADPSSLMIVTPVVLVFSFVLFLLSRHYNVIATGEETAVQLGVSVESVKRTSYLLASLITGVVVSVSGVIGFVGLIIPHICRILFGADHRVLLPASFLGGAAFLIVVDLAARTVLSPMEIPVGAVTAIVGAPMFIWLLKRRV